MSKALDYICPLNVRPRHQEDGEIFFYVDAKLVNKDDEIALGLMYICDRKLFGAGYRKLIGNYFESMGKASGVMIYPFAKSSGVVPDLNFPGDIDLLVIPYEDNQLIVSKTLAIELKIIRAKFTKQEKSPNDFGFSQSIFNLKSIFKTFTTISDSESVAMQRPVTRAESKSSPVADINRHHCAYTAPELTTEKSPWQSVC